MPLIAITQSTPLKLRTVEILGQRVQFATESLSRHRDSVIAYH
jgi:hypothetical protein